MINKEHSMIVVEVNIVVKPDFIEEFIAATVANAEASLRESGVARFDFLQDVDDPTRFVLVEVYRTQDAPAKHKQTDHYKTWKAVAEDMMALPRTKKVYVNIFPEDKGWN
jgi:(4S)-4-hydroxy-5-phosphonooxypentane-2,3-dione isomerase